MWAYVIRRVLAIIPVMATVAVVVFLILHLNPDDPAAIIAGDDASTAHIENIRRQLGLDRPVYVQFFDWVLRLIGGDLGASIFLDRPVLQLILERVEPTLALAISTTIFSVCLALPLGVLAAWKAGTWIDQTIMALAVLAFSFPVFLIGYGLVQGWRSNSTCCPSRASSACPRIRSSSWRTSSCRRSRWGSSTPRCWRA